MAVKNMSTTLGHDPPTPKVIPTSPAAVAHLCRSAPLHDVAGVDRSKEAISPFALDLDVGR